MSNTTQPSRVGLIAQTVTQIAIMGAMLLGAILIVSSQEGQPMTIEVPVDVDVAGETPAVEIGEPRTIYRGTASRTLNSPGGIVEGWYR